MSTRYRFIAHFACPVESGHASLDQLEVNLEDVDRIWELVEGCQCTLVEIEELPPPQGRPESYRKNECCRSCIHVHHGGSYMGIDDTWHCTIDGSERPEPTGDFTEYLAWATPRAVAAYGTCDEWEGS